MNTYIVIYTHRHGTNTGLVQCERIPTQDEIIAAFEDDWEFELDRDDEFLEFEGAPEPIIIP